MAIRSTKPSAPPLAAADVPVTAAMLGKVRTEVLQRLDHSREEGKADNQNARTDIQRLDAKIDAVKADLHELKADLHEVKATMHGMQAMMHGMQATMSRIEALVEEQNARYKIVIDGIAALLSRQNQLRSDGAIPPQPRVEPTLHAIP